MYTGTLIEDLFATVERAEARTRVSDETTELERWYATAHEPSPRAEQNLLGVA